MTTPRRFAPLLALAVLALAGCGGTGSPPGALAAATRSVGGTAPAPATSATSAASSPTATTDASPPAAPALAGSAAPTAESSGGTPQLPRGGRTLLPNWRLVAYYGSGSSKDLGVLGQTDPEQAALAVSAQAAKFATPDRPVMPAFELITTNAQGSPGRDGDYSAGVLDEVVQRYLDAARRHQMYLILDFQPGRSRFLPQVKLYEKFLREPDVGLALDPEWRMGPGEVPGKKIGKVTAAEVNEVSAYVEQLTKDANLPQKLFVVHTFTQFMIVNREQLQPRPDLAMLIHLDGFGDRSLKLDKYAGLHASAPFFNGFKLFYKNDVNLFSPQEVLATLDPKPDLITYQ